MRKIAFAALAATTVTFTVAAGEASAAAPFKSSVPALTPAPDKVICQGNRRNYTGFNHCMRVNTRGLRYCNRICGS